MNVSIVIATAGDPAWADLAWSRAYPSADAQDGRREIVIEHRPDLSVPAARNAAAANASGAWLCFLDADDELEPGYLTAMTDAWIRGAITVDWDPLLVPHVRRVHPDCREEGPAIPNRGKWPTTNECVVGTLIRRTRFERLGGFRDLPSLEDYDLFLRAYDDGADLVYVPAAVYRECVNPAGRNSSQAAYESIWADHLARVEAIR